ncbi:Creatinase/aminopeptidase [Wallemia mellicola]|uniref:Creatinase/aminopeptidase n=1 Tax=Wallemia mellicola TaxID=1708541 RepID=A0A4T0NNM7_9BASI|nr:Creatinase/aminopeptidase [Wallemia mellicola]
MTVDDSSMKSDNRSQSNKSSVSVQTNNRNDIAIQTSPALYDNNEASQNGLLAPSTTSLAPTAHNGVYGNNSNIRSRSVSFASTAAPSRVGVNDPYAAFRSKSTISLALPTGDAIEIEDEPDQLPTDQKPGQRTPSPQQPSTKMQIFRRMCIINLVAFSFGIDSTLWLPSVYNFILTLRPNDADRYLAVTQAVSALAQFIVSLSIGVFAAKVHSLKWTIVVCIALSFAGNFLYSCAGVGALNNVGAIIGGRILCGIASGSSGLAMGFIAISTANVDRLEALSQYRTYAGIALVLGPALNALFGLIDIKIGNYTINENNAPTYCSSFIMALLAILLGLFLSNKTKPAPNPIVPAIEFFRRGHYGPSLIILCSMLSSSYVSALILYVLPDRLSSFWGFSTGVQAGLQTAVYAAGLIGSLLSSYIRDGLGRLVLSITSWKNGVDKVTLLERAKADGGVSAGAPLYTGIGLEILLGIVSFLWVSLGLIAMIISFGLDFVYSSSQASTAAGFLIGCAVVMVGYNIQAAVLPTLFSKSLPNDLRVALTPWYGATVAMGKILAPLITEAITKATPTGGRTGGNQIGGYALALGVPIEHLPSFETKLLQTSQTELNDRLEDFRELLTDNKLDYYIVPTTDAHASEYVADADARLAFLSGFTGSSGVAIVGAYDAHLWTDSRYYIQAERELSRAWTLHKDGLPGVPTWTEWLSKYTQSARIGVDPKLMTYKQATSIEDILRDVESQLIYTAHNLIDQIWYERPALPLRPLFVLGMEFTGKHASEKLEDVDNWLGPKRAFIASALDDIAWVLNLRCQDSVPFNPVFYSYLLISQSKKVLFVYKDQLTGVVSDYLSDLNVEIKDYANIDNTLKSVSSNYTTIFTSETVSRAVASDSGFSRIRTTTSPITLAKAAKNPVELKGAREAYKRDGLAFVRFLAWLDGQVRAGNPDLTEWNVSAKFDEIRSKLPLFKGLAYENISATGANAALPHYSTSKDNSPKLDLTTPYLNDSGGQYLDGTCDTTRTVHFGKPTKEQKVAFTRVLQGHIAIDSLVFPEGTTGGHIDVLARRPLWLENLDFGHGTGHGIGAYLNVHEGPHGINKGLSFAQFPLRVGCMNSNEPGYYAENKFGMRIESVVTVKESSKKGWLKYERLTKVPIDKRLVDYSLLTQFEKDWLNVGTFHVLKYTLTTPKAHNEDVKQTLLPLLDKSDKLTRKWLQLQ